MNYTQEEIATMVAKKCEEAFAPIYAQIEELRAKYYPTMAKVEQQPTEPTPDPEEVRQAEFKKQLAEMKQMLIESGRIPRETKKNN